MMNPPTMQPSSTIQVLMMPDFRLDNPYQSLLAQALKQQNIQVDFNHYYLKFFPCSRAVLKYQWGAISIVHLHWIEFYIKSPYKLATILACLLFLIDILILRLMGIKMVWTVHNLVSHNSEFPQLEIWLRSYLSKFVDHLIFHNQSSLELVKKDHPINLKKVRVIPHGNYRTVYGSPVDSQNARQELDLPLTGRIYLNLGYLKPYKGLEKLLSVWTQHSQQFPEDTLLIAGKPVHEAYALELTQQASQQNNVKLRLEFIEDSKISVFFSASDVVIFPFKKILTSGSLILAMSYNKPIIAPKLGGIAETLGRAGKLLYDPKDPEGLQKALQQSTEINLHRLSEQVKKECDRLNWEEIATHTKNLYKKALMKPSFLLMNLQNNSEL